MHAMNISQLTRFIALLLIALTISATPADAHKKKKHPEQAAPTSQVAAPAEPQATAAAPAAAEASQDDHMAGMMQEMEEERSSMSAGERLLDWLGRLHPIIVHFPIAFFPAALFTAIVGRRRPAFAAPVQFLVIAGGIIAPIAAMLGWLSAIGADPDPLMTAHRWLGTVIGITALPLAIWAWRRPAQVGGIGMIIALSITSAAIVVQGWFGGALVHGMDHMNW
jgi:uncharacterized membrane protein